MSESGWTPEKVRIFKEQYLEFRYFVKINSKDLGGGAVLGEHTYLSQKMLLDGVFDALANDIHDIKILKSRQLGITTESRALSLFWNGVHNGLQGAMVYDTDSNKNNARRDLELVINSLPAKLKFPKIVVNNRDGFILSNDSKIAIMAAGTRSSRTGGGLGRSVGLNFAHCTEMCSWDNTEGVISFQQSLSEVFQNRLYLWESTARGPGLWQDSWDDARKDTTNQKAVFIGWWAKDSQRLDKNSRAFHQYGLTPPNADEQKRIDAVQRLYGVTVTQEQLAWYRRKMDPSGEGEDDVRDQREGDDFKNAEQPWTEDEAFIAAGSTFFAPERLAEIRGKDTSNKYKGYRYYPGTSFVTCQVEPARNWRETQLKVWEEPVDDAIYVIAGDPAFGHDEENDNSCLEVLRCYADCIEQVAEFSDPLTPTNHFAWIMWSLIGWYGGGHSGNATNPVHSILELNGPGDAVWLEFKSVPNIARNGYLRVEAKEKGLLNIFNNVRNYIYTRSDSMGVGSAYHFKCLALDTPIPTPSGWAEMQDLKVGDKVYSDKGDPCSVIGVSPVYENKECFDVVFDDGGCITADADHLWELFDGSIVKTKQLKAQHSRIRVTGHLLGSFAALPIDPYTLGVWLGDGSSACGRIHGHVKDLEEVRLQIAPHEQAGPVTPEKKNKQIGYFGIRGFTAKLRSLGVLNNKHIPPAYLRASLADRLGLLQGLMDTDGTINAKNGRQCAFVTTSPALRDGFAELLRSLGIKAKYITKNPTLFYNGSTRICAEAYQFWFTAYPDLPAFRMKRKRERTYLKTGQKVRSTAKTHRVMQVVSRASVPVKCIMVDSPSHLFLAGRSMIPTHNTTGATKVSIMERLRGYTLDGTVIVHSQDALDEMRQVTRKGDVIKAEGRKKDDKVITLALGCRAWDDRARKALIAQNLTKKADSARRAASIQDQYMLFSNNMLSDFFKSKQRVRLHERAMLRRQGWRGR